MFWRPERVMASFRSRVGFLRLSRPHLVCMLFSAPSLLEMKFFSETFPPSKQNKLASAVMETNIGSNHFYYAQCHSKFTYGKHTRLPSSKCQAFMIKARLATSVLMCSMIGWRVSANRTAPSGSPCWSPLQLLLDLYLGEESLDINNRTPTIVIYEEGTDRTPRAWLPN